MINTSYFMKNTKPKLNKKLFRYLIVGGFNTLASYIIYASILLIYGNIAIASLVSLVCGIMISYSSQGKLVFEYVSVDAFLRYIFVWLLIYVIHVSMIYSLMWIGISPYYGAIYSLFFTAVISYIVLDRYVFKV